MVVTNSTNWVSIAVLRDYAKNRWVQGRADHSLKGELMEELDGNSDTE